MTDKLTIPAGAFFWTYESAKSALGRALPSGVPQSTIHAVASGSAELVSCIVLTPAEVIKQNAQVLRQSGTRHDSSLRALRMLNRAEGGLPRRLWSGYTALAARNLPFTALQFPLFELFRGDLWDRRRGHGDASGGGSRGASYSSGDRTPTLIEVGTVNGAAAAASGSLAAWITTPMDVVKTRMMLGADKTQSGSTSRPQKKNTGAFSVAKTIVGERGIRGLFRGAALRVSWTAIGSGVYLGSYEVAKTWLRQGKSSDGDRL